MNLRGVSKAAGVLLAECQAPAIITFSFIVCLLLNLLKSPMKANFVFHKELFGPYFCQSTPLPSLPRDKDTI